MSSTRVSGGVDAVELSSYDAAPEMGRGYQWLREPSVIGSVIGAIGGSAFVLVNHGKLPDIWSLLSLATWAFLLVVWLSSTFVLRRERPRTPPPRRRAWIVYGASVLGMQVIMIGGSAVLRHLGEETSVPALVAMAVGLHFLPFAYAFRTRIFLAIGLMLTVFGALGIAGEVLRGSGAAASAAVLAGLTMIGIMTLATLTPQDG